MRLKQHVTSSLGSIVLLCRLPCITSQLSPWYNFYRQNEDRMMITDGILPTLSCPYGNYRDFDKGILLDGCVKCPPGRFGNTTDLHSSNCTAPCPLGTFLDRYGGISSDDCTPCPAGTFGEEEGLTSDLCSGRCEELNTNTGKSYYSFDKGLTSRKQCKRCQRGYNYHDCKWQWPVFEEEFYQYMIVHERVESLKPEINLYL